MNSGNLLIDRTTSIKTLLDADQDAVISALIALNKNFVKLKNPLLRKLFAKRVSIADACKIAGCNISDFLRTMKSLGFRLKEIDTDESTVAACSFVLPAQEKIVEYDVRPVLAENKDPLKEILARIKHLKQDECLKVINTFEPVPLIALLNKQGFKSYTEHLKQDLVISYFYRELEDISTVSAVPAPAASASGFEEMLSAFSGSLRTVDVTAMEMPLPMHTILDELNKLAEDEALFVHHKKTPVYLLPHLNDKGYEYLIREEKEGKVSMLIYKI